MLRLGARLPAAALVFGRGLLVVELPYEDLLRQELRKLKRRFLEEHIECLSEPQLEQFLGRVLEASNYGVSVSSATPRGTGTDFTALFFASTVKFPTTGRRPAPRPRPPIGLFDPPALPPSVPVFSGAAHAGPAPRRRKPAEVALELGVASRSSWIVVPKPSAWAAAGSPSGAASLVRDTLPRTGPLGVVQSWRPQRWSSGLMETLGCSEGASPSSRLASRRGRAAEPLTR